MKYWQKFTQQLLKVMHWLESLHFYQSIRKAFAILFPIVLFGSIVFAIQRGFFSKNGYYYQVFYLDHVVPGISIISYGLDALNHLLNDYIAVMASFLITYYYTNNKRNKVLGGLTSVLVFLALNLSFGTGNNHFQMNNLGLRGLFLAMLTSYIVGRIFNWHAKKRDQQLATRSLRDYLSIGAIDRIWVITTLVLLAASLSFGLSYLTDGGLNGLIYSVVQVPEKSLGHVVEKILTATGFNNLLVWFGLAGPLSIMGQTTPEATMTANMNAALQHGNLKNVPYPITVHTLFDTFGNFGGSGMTLALIIAILIVAKQANLRRIATYSSFTSFLNINDPLMIGLPLIWNPILLIPFIITPIFNMIVAWSLIRLGLLFPSVYSIGWTTPGPLVAFLGTNGNWFALFVSFICLTLSVLIYLPFVRLYDQHVRLWKAGDEVEA